ncbi:NAC domain [Macleaya cordata]|uniref:NAC domain n=1 Tax=Macleaya cordata TaxID=56857 RepID=A0A200PW96_MACCD|nr:NAC domain [Macleaya cordata]
MASTMGTLNNQIPPSGLRFGAGARDLREEAHGTICAKTGTGKRVLRTAGIGTWTGQDRGKEIYDDQNEVIGFKKHFAFTLGKTNKSSSPSSSSADSWIMHEFSLCSSDPKKEETVICKIRRKRAKSTGLQ